MNNTDPPIVKDLVLIGGGHSHIAVLRSFGMKPVPGVRLTLICPDVYTPYSGMLPGFIAGHYQFDDIHIDLAVLARFAGARLFLDAVTGIDPVERRVLCANRTAVPYDLVSVNAGSTPNTADVPGAADFVIPVKPINRFAAGWEDLSARLVARDGALRLGVVGGGAGGVELALAVSHRLHELRGETAASGSLEVHLVTQEDDILTTHNHRAAALLNRQLVEHGVSVHRKFRVSEVRSGELRNGTGEALNLDEILWVTQAAAPAWLRTSGLAVDDDGFMLVDASLHSVSHPEVFGVGDAACIANFPRPKSGVFAVRQGKPLARNLRRALLGRTTLSFSPQRQFLSLIATGPKHAVASRAGWSIEGRWAWRWKDWIDRRFMRKYSDLPEMPEAPAPSLPSGLGERDTLTALASASMRCGGCGAKIGSPVLERVLAKLNGIKRDDVLIGLDNVDDAAVVEVPEGKVLLQTVDSFRALVDDPFLFGKITANHCLNDIYAMGGEPQTALAIVTIPFGLESKVEDTLAQLLAGASTVLSDAGTQLIGGHSGEGAELALGFSVNGLADRDRLLRKAGLKPGDKLILTKAIGTGTLFAAEMRGKAKGRWVAGALETMLLSNQDAARCLVRKGATSCTDVTGFGLAGHLAEMIAPTEVAVDLDLAAVPVLEGASDTVAAGITSSLQPQNLVARDAISNVDRGADNDRFALLFDPQTAGGLLAGVPADQAEDCVAELQALGYGQSAIIGTVRPADDRERPIKIVT